MDDAEVWKVMRGVSREIDGSESAGEKNLAVISEAFFFAMKKGAGGEKACAREVEKNDFAERAENADVVLVGVVAEKHHCGEDHHDADADKPVGAEAHFQGFAFGGRWRHGRRCRL